MIEVPIHQLPQVRIPKPRPKSCVQFTERFLEAEPRGLSCMSHSKSFTVMRR